MPTIEGSLGKAINPSAATEEDTKQALSAQNEDSMQDTSWLLPPGMGPDFFFAQETFDHLPAWISNFHERVEGALDVQFHAALQNTKSEERDQASSSTQIQEVSANTKQEPHAFEPGKTSEGERNRGGVTTEGKHKEGTRLATIEEENNIENEGNSGGNTLEEKTEDNSFKVVTEVEAQGVSFRHRVKTLKKGPSWRLPGGWEKFTYSKTCLVIGCTKQSKRCERGTLFCTRHGGGMSCAHPLCFTAAVAPSRFCIRHGGGRRCSVKTCPTACRPASHFCAKHRLLFIQFECFFFPMEYKQAMLRARLNFNKFGRASTKRVRCFGKIVDRQFGSWTSKKRAKRLMLFKHFQRVRAST